MDNFANMLNLQEEEIDFHTAMGLIKQPTTQATIFKHCEDYYSVLTVHKKYPKRPIYWCRYKNKEFYYFDSTSSRSFRPSKNKGTIIHMPATSGKSRTLRNLKTTNEHKDGDVVLKKSKVGRIFMKKKGWYNDLRMKSMISRISRGILTVEGKVNYIDSRAFGLMTDTLMACLIGHKQLKINTKHRIKDNDMQGKDKRIYEEYNNYVHGVQDHVPILLFKTFDKSNLGIIERFIKYEKGYTDKKYLRKYFHFLRLEKTSPTPGENMFERDNFEQWLNKEQTN